MLFVLVILLHQCSLPFRSVTCVLFVLRHVHTLPSKHYSLQVGKIRCLPSKR